MLKHSALKISENLEDNVETYDIKKIENIDLTQCDNVVIGGSVYGGKI